MSKTIANITDVIRIGSNGGSGLWVLVPGVVVLEACPVRVFCLYIESQLIHVLGGWGFGESGRDLSVWVGSDPEGLQGTAPDSTGFGRLGKGKRVSYGYHRVTCDRTREHSLLLYGTCPADMVSAGQGLVFVFSATAVTNRKQTMTP